MMSTPRNSLSELTIIQFNCNHSNHSERRPFFDALDPQNQHIIAIQEPHIYNNNNNTGTYCPPGYTLAISEDPATRVAFLISKVIRIRD